MLMNRGRLLFLMNSVTIKEELLLMIMCIFLSSVHVLHLLPLPRYHQQHKHKNISFILQSIKNSNYLSHSLSHCFFLLFLMFIHLQNIKKYVAKIKVLTRKHLHRHLIKKTGKIHFFCVVFITTPPLPYPLPSLNCCDLCICFMFLNFNLI